MTVAVGTLHRTPFSISNASVRTPVIRRSVAVMSLVLPVLGCWGTKSEPGAAGAAAAPAAAAAGAGERCLCFDAHKPEGASDKVVAEFGNVKIYQSDFLRRIEQQSPTVRERYATLERKKDFLQTIIRFELQVQAALADGLADDPEVERTAKQVMVQNLRRARFESNDDVSALTDAELKAYYDANAADFNRPEQVRAAHILIKVEPGADDAAYKKAEAKARDVRKELSAALKSKPDAFSEFAEKYSDDAANKSRGGDLGFFSRTQEGGRMHQAFSDGAFALKNINDVSEPVRTPFGVHLIQLTARREKIERTFDEVKEQIKSRLQRTRMMQKFEDYLRDLEKKFPVKVYDDALAAIRIESTPQPGEGGVPLPPVTSPGVPTAPAVPSAPVAPPAPPR